MRPEQATPRRPRGRVVGVWLTTLGFMTIGFAHSWAIHAMGGPVLPLFLLVPLALATLLAIGVTLGMRSLSALSAVLLAVVSLITIFSIGLFGLAYLLVVGAIHVYTKRNGAGGDRGRDRMTAT